MSRAAYEAYFRQAAPAGAYFGTDISWYQGATRGAAVGYWADIHTWADFVCVRTSYGGGGDDGAQATHFGQAAELSYAGAMGTYHFATWGPGVQANYDNYIASSDSFVDRTSFDMLDYEAAPNVGWEGIDQLCDMVEQHRQRPCLPYSGKGYLDAAGSIKCPATKFWVAHYPGRSADAWSPTADWSSNGAPLMPYQYGAVYPGCWQWQSQTPQHGSLDLNITTTPESFGIGGGDDLSAEDTANIEWIKAHLLASDMGALPLIRNNFNSLSAILQNDLPALQYIRNIYNSTTGGTLPAIQASVDKLAVPGVDVDKLARAIAGALDIEGSTAKALAQFMAHLLAQLAPAKATGGTEPPEGAHLP